MVVLWQWFQILMYKTEYKIMNGVTKKVYVSHRFLNVFADLIFIFYPLITLWGKSSHLILNLISSNHKCNNQ